MATILVIDANSTHQRVLRYMLQRHSHAVVSADGATQAMERLAETTFDLVVTRLRLPAPDGLALLRQLRASAEYRALPVLVLTDSGYAEDRRRALAAGAADVLLLPVGTDEISTAVNSLTQKRSAPQSLTVEEALPLKRGS